MAGHKLMLENLKAFAWAKGFDDRQLNEILLSQIYASDFSHGTDGHNAKLIIAKMAQLLSAAEESLNG